MKRAMLEGFSVIEPQGLAVTHQRVDGLSNARLCCHPLLTAEPRTRLHRAESGADGRSSPRAGWPHGWQALVACFADAHCKTLPPEKHTQVAEDGQDRRKQHLPLKVANPWAQKAIVKRLE